MNGPLYSLLLGVREDVGLEVGGLCELLVAAVEGADVGPVPRVDPHVRPQVEVQREPLPATLERALQERDIYMRGCVNGPKWQTNKPPTLPDTCHGDCGH